MVNLSIFTSVSLLHYRIKLGSYFVYIYIYKNVLARKFITLRTIRTVYFKK